MNCNWLKERPIAHRGLHDIKNGVPENTIAAFQAAVEKQYPIELDLQITKDGKLIVFHDYDTKRLTGENLSIANSTYKQLEKLSILNTDQKIPLFYEVLSLVSDKVPLMIEIKNPKRPGRLEETLLLRLRQYKGRFAVQSFNPMTVSWFRRKAPDFCTGLLLLESLNDNNLKDIIKVLLECIYSRPMFLNYYIPNIFNKFVSKNKSSGKTILGWTARSKEEFEKAMKICDNVTFENFLP